jgi:hypothetical protein
LPIRQRGWLERRRASVLDLARSFERQPERDLAAGLERWRCRALASKHPGANREWAWHWLWPATRPYVDGVTGEHWRHHLHETVIQRAVKDAGRRRG